MKKYILLSRLTNPRTMSVLIGEIFQSYCKISACLCCFDALYNSPNDKPMWLACLSLSFSSVLPSLNRRHVAIARLSTPANLGTTHQEVQIVVLVLAPVKEVGTTTEHTAAWDLYGIDIAFICIQHRTFNLLVLILIWIVHIYKPCI